MEKRNNYTSIKVNVEVILDDECLDYLERYHRIAAEKGLNVTFEKFIESLFAVGAAPHLKRQAAFYIGGEIID